MSHEQLWFCVLAPNRTHHPRSFVRRHFVCHLKPLSLSRTRMGRDIIRYLRRRFRGKVRSDLAGLSQLVRVLAEKSPFRRDHRGFAAQDRLSAEQPLWRSRFWRRAHIASAGVGPIFTGNDAFPAGESHQRSDLLTGLPITHSAHGDADLACTRITNQLSAAFDYQSLARPHGLLRDSLGEMPTHTLL
jgi:hypothetical protein